jgi:hypothetical protein
MNKLNKDYVDHIESNLPNPKNPISHTNNIILNREFITTKKAHYPQKLESNKS